RPGRRYQREHAPGMGDRFDGRRNGVNPDDVALEELMLTSLIATLAHWFAPWKALYSDSKLLETGVTSVHVVATLVGGGIAIAADRDNLRTMKGQPDECPQILD